MKTSFRKLLPVIPAGERNNRILKVFTGITAVLAACLILPAAFSVHPAAPAVSRTTDTFMLTAFAADMGDTSDTVSSGNTVTAESGNISISIHSETDCSDDVMPGQAVDYRLIIDNNKARTWLRIRIDLGSQGTDLSFTDSCLSVSNQWKKIGNYYYCTDSASKGESFTVIDGFRVPDITRADEGANISIAATAEAINYTAIDPDFDSSDPWKNIKPAVSVTYAAGSGNSSGLHSAEAAKDDWLIRYSAPSGSKYIRNYSVSSGYWYLIDAEKQLWRYGDAASGSYASNGWYLIWNPYSTKGNSAEWFHFSEDAYMDTGWFRADDTVWYHLNEKSDGDFGALHYEWYRDTQDGQIYYLSPETGQMVSGWQEISGKRYYFASLSEAVPGSWFLKLLDNTALGRWVYTALGYRSYGSLYINEYTPDGTFAGKDGSA